MSLDDAAIVEAYEKAKRAWGDFSPPDNPCVEITFDGFDRFDVQDLLCPEIAAVWLWRRHLRKLELIDAWEELYLHVLEHGEIETENGLWTLDAGSFLVFRRFIDVAYMGRFSCN